MSKFHFKEMLYNLNRSKNLTAKKLIVASKNYFVKNFEYEQSPDDALSADWWPELSERYKQYKNSKWGDQQILVASGSLLKALKNSVVTGSTSWTNCKLVVVNPYGEYHNEGLGNNPKRTFVAHSKDLERIQIDILDQWIIERLQIK